jgi:hypothetical protein
MREERERLLADLERERERASRLEQRAEQLRDELEAERSKAFCGPGLGRLPPRRGFFLSDGPIIKGFARVYQEIYLTFF